MALANAGSLVFGLGIGTMTPGLSTGVAAGVSAAGLALLIARFTI